MKSSPRVLDSRVRTGVIITETGRGQDKYCSNNN